MTPATTATSIWCPRRAASKSTACASTPAMALRSAMKPGSPSPRWKIPNWCWSTRRRASPTTLTVMAGQKREARLRARCPGHPRNSRRKTWMPGTRPGMTENFLKHQTQPQTHRRNIMAKVLVLYYSAYGHIEAMANAVAEGAREAGATVDIKRVPELVPPDLAKASYYNLDQAAPIAKIEDLPNYDAVIVGTGTRFGRITSQMANFLDQAGGLWAKGALHGKVGGAFTSSATQHGGQETTLFSIITNLLHFGMVIVGLDYGYGAQMTLAEVTGGSPYGATTIASTDGSRKPSERELDGARYQGRRVGGGAAELF